MTRVLVTGSSGFLGRYVVETAAERYDVLGTYFTTDVSYERAETVRVDLTEPPFPALQEYDPDYVVHCAGLADVDDCEENPERARELNVSMAERVASLAAAVDARLVYVSTDAVFDGSRPWWAEDDRPNPINVYGRTKLDGERATSRILDDAMIVRTNFVGWTSEGDSSLAEWMLGTLESGERLTGFEDVFFTPLYAGDLANELFELLDRGYTGTVHLGGSERISKYGFALELADVFGFAPGSITPIEISELDLAAPRGRDLSLDVSQAESTLGRPMPDVRTTLERMRDEST